jgi:hypothetical protein
MIVVRYHGMHWTIMNRRLTKYGAYSIAVDPSQAETVYAGTEGGERDSKWS